MYTETGGCCLSRNSLNRLETVLALSVSIHFHLTLYDSVPASIHYIGDEDTFIYILDYLFWNNSARLWVFHYLLSTYLLDLGSTWFSIMANSLPNFPPFKIREQDTSTGIRWKKWISKLENLIIAMDISCPTRKKLSYFTMVEMKFLTWWKHYQTQKRKISSLWNNH